MAPKSRIPKSAIEAGKQFAANKAQAEAEAEASKKAETIGAKVAEQQAQQTKAEEAEVKAKTRKAEEAAVEAKLHAEANALDFASLISLLDQTLANVATDLSVEDQEIRNRNFDAMALKARVDNALSEIEKELGRIKRLEELAKAGLPVSIDIEAAFTKATTTEAQLKLFSQKNDQYLTGNELYKIRYWKEQYDIFCGKEVAPTPVVADPKAATPATPHNDSTKNPSNLNFMGVLKALENKRFYDKDGLLVKGGLISHITNGFSAELREKLANVPEKSKGRVKRLFRRDKIDEEAAKVLLAKGFLNLGDIFQSEEYLEWRSNILVTIDEKAHAVWAKNNPEEAEAERLAGSLPQSRRNTTVGTSTPIVSVPTVRNSKGKDVAVEDPDKFKAISDGGMDAIEAKMLAAAGEDQ